MSNTKNTLIQLQNKPESASSLHTNIERFFLILLGICVIIFLIAALFSKN
jgi:Flp pilus assembly protein TadB